MELLTWMKVLLLQCQKQMGKANAKNKSKREKLTMLNTLRKKMKRSKFESKVSELQAKYNSIKSKL